MKTLAIALLLLFVPTASMAADMSNRDHFFDGNRLKERLEDKGTERAIAIGYVAGISDSLDGNYFCVPKGATLGQLVAVVEKYLEDNPENWHHFGYLLVMLALGKAFPCEK